MAATLTEWWNDIAPKLRRALGLAPLTIKEAETEMAEAEAAPMTDEEIEEIVRFAVDEPVCVHCGGPLDTIIPCLVRSYGLYPQRCRACGNKYREDRRKKIDWANTGNRVPLAVDRETL